MFNNPDAGLFLVRLGIGLNVLVLSGWAKVTGGEALLHQVVSAMPSFGIPWMPLVWGALAAFAEAGGSILLILGVSFRFAAFLLAFTMAVAVTAHLGMPPGPYAGWQGASHALTNLSIYLALLLFGPGKYVLKLKK